MQKKHFALALLSVILLMGCAGEANVSTMTIDKNGAVQSYIVEDFTASYYDVEELRNSVLEDISYVNEQHEQTAIELTKYEVVEGGWKAIIEYQNADVYEDFNEETLYVGLWDEALDEGYDVTAEMENDNYRILIFSEPVDVKVTKKIVYVSDGLQKTSSKKVTVTDKEKEIYYIIYE